jgi:hypothetical protein
MTSSLHEIKKMWRIITVHADSVIELRAIWPKGLDGSQPLQVKQFYARDYRSIDELKAAFETAALELNDRGFNIYVVMNPIIPDFKGPGAAKDADIRFRDLLLIDIDRVGDTSRPANQAELDAATSLANQIRDQLERKGWPPATMVMSGNGVHLYYPLCALPNDSESTTLVRQTLANLAVAFNNDVVGIDTAVYNASRITKVPGTIMRKGVESEGRPYRMAAVCDEI